MTPPEGLDLEDLRQRVDLEAQRLHSERIWTVSRDEELAALFEQCAEEALRAPALAERSIHLRRLAGRFLPASLRPAARALFHVVDRAVRRLYRISERFRGTR